MYPSLNNNTNTTSNNNNSNNNNYYNNNNRDVESSTVPLIPKPTAPYTSDPINNMGGNGMGTTTTTITTTTTTNGKAPVAQWLTSTKAWKRNCCRFWFCLVLWGFIVCTIMLGLIVQCLQSTWHETIIYEIDLNANTSPTTPINSLLIDVDFGDVFVSFAPSNPSLSPPDDPTTPQLIRIETRIYSIYRKDAKEYELPYTVNNLTQQGHLDASEGRGSVNEGLNILGRCVKPEINIILPLSPSSLANFAITINVNSNSQVRFAGDISIPMRSVSINSGFHTTPIYVFNTSASSISLDATNRIIKSYNTFSSYFMSRTSNKKIRLVNHTVDNHYGGSAFIGTSNSEIIARGFAFAYSNISADGKFETSNAKASVEMTAGYTGMFSVRTSNGEAKIKTDTTSVVFSTNTKEEKVGYYPGPGVDAPLNIDVSSSNKNINFSN